MRVSTIYHMHFALRTQRRRRSIEESTTSSDGGCCLSDPFVGRLRCSAWSLRGYDRGMHGSVYSSSVPFLSIGNPKCTMYRCALRRSSVDMRSRGQHILQSGFGCPTQRLEKFALSSEHMRREDVMTRSPVRSRPK